MRIWCVSVCACCVHMSMCVLRHHAQAREAIFCLVNMVRVCYQECQATLARFCVFLMVRCCVGVVVARGCVSVASLSLLDCVCVITRPFPPPTTARACIGRIV
jgi:uncharacterized membrane protein YhaH (DUF805 family)